MRDYGVPGKAKASRRRTTTTFICMPIIANCRPQAQLGPDRI